MNVCKFKTKKSKLLKDHATGILLYGTKHEENAYISARKNKTRKNKKKG